jgi:hypothetical protein
MSKVHKKRIGTVAGDDETASSVDDDEEFGEIVGVTDEQSNRAFVPDLPRQLTKTIREKMEELRDWPITHKDRAAYWIALAVVLDLTLALDCTYRNVPRRQVWKKVCVFTPTQLRPPAPELIAEAATLALCVRPAICAQPDLKHYAAIHSVAQVQYITDLVAPHTALRSLPPEAQLIQTFQRLVPFVGIKHAVAGRGVAALMEQSEDVVADLLRKLLCGLPTTVRLANNADPQFYSLVQEAESAQQIQEAAKCVLKEILRVQVAGGGVMRTLGVGLSRPTVPPMSTAGSSAMPLVAIGDSSALFCNYCRIVGHDANHCLTLARRNESAHQGADESGQQSHQWTKKRSRNRTLKVPQVAAARRTNP